MKKTAFFTVMALLATIHFSYGQLDLSKSKLEIEKLGENVSLFVQQVNIANPSSVVYHSPELSILIDPGFKQMQPLIEDSIKALGGGDIEFVMATHFHIDHGQAMEDYYNNTTILLSSIQYSNSKEMDIKNVMTSDEVYTLKLGDEELEVHSMPESAGHTGGDALFFFKKANVLVAGDYLFQDMYPIIDVAGGGSLDGYFENIDYILNLSNKTTKIIPGHTSFRVVEKRYVSKEEYRAHIQKLKESIEHIRSMKDKGLSVENAIQKGLPDKFGYLNEGIKYVSQEKWIKFIYDQL